MTKVIHGNWLILRLNQGQLPRLQLMHVQAFHGSQLVVGTYTNHSSVMIQRTAGRWTIRPIIYWRPLAFRLF